MKVDKDRARKMRAEGMTLQAIGDHFDVTRERIRQIVGGEFVQRATECQGCGAALPKDGHPRRKYCTDDCRKRYWERTHPKKCRLCDQDVNHHTKALCIDCHRRQAEVKRLARWTHIETLWEAGFLLREIAEAIGWTAGSLGVEMACMKHAGRGLPVRRVGWNGFTKRVGAPVRLVDDTKLTRQQVSNRLQHAIKSGKLTRPDRCERCGREGYVDGHHHDYSKPLDVEWLCRRCHMAHHVAERQAAA